METFFLALSTLQLACRIILRSINYKVKILKLAEAFDG